MRTDPIPSELDKPSLVIFRPMRTLLLSLLFVGFVRIVLPGQAEAGICAGDSSGKATSGWGRPWVMLKGAVGIPDVFSGRIEGYIPMTPVTLEVGFSVQGLLGHTLATAVKWRPSGTCWGCSGRHLFSMGFGVEGNFIFHSSTTTAILIAAAVDMHYVFRIVEHFGLMLGILGGFGVGWEVYHTTSSSGPSKVEPAAFGRLYAGFAF